METLIFQGIPAETFLESLRSVIQQEVNTALKSFARQEDEKLISPAEVCKVFQPSISKVTLLAWTKAGHLQSYRIGSRVYYKRSEVIAAAGCLKKYKLKAA